MDYRETMEVDSHRNEVRPNKVLGAGAAFQKNQSRHLMWDWLYAMQFSPSRPRTADDLSRRKERDDYK